MISRLVYLGVIVITAIKEANSWTSYEFKDHCDYNLHVLSTNETVFVQYNHETLPKAECAIGFHSNQSTYKTCMRLEYYKVNHCDLKLKGSNGNGSSKTWSGCTKKNKKKKNKKTFCSGGKLRISLHNANKYTDGEFSLRVYLEEKPQDDEPLYWLIPVGVFGGIAVICFVFMSNRQKRKKEKESKKSVSAENPPTSVNNNNKSDNNKSQGAQTQAKPNGETNQGAVSKSIGTSNVTSATKTKGTSNKPAGLTNKTQVASNKPTKTTNQSKEEEDQAMDGDRKTQFARKKAEVANEKCKMSNEEQTPEQLSAQNTVSIDIHSVLPTVPPYEEHVAVPPYQIHAGTNNNPTRTNTSITNPATLYQVRPARGMLLPPLDINQQSRRSNHGDVFTILTVGQEYDVPPVSSPPQYADLYPSTQSASEA